MKYLAIIVFLFSGLISFAQGDQDEVLATGERKVEKAYRLTLAPQIIDTVIPTVIVDYPLLLIQMETQTEIETINPAAISTKENLSQLYNTYIKLGIGSELMPLGEVYFDSKRSRKYIYGAHVKHISSFGNIPNYATSTFDRTRAEIYGGLNEKKYSLRGNVHYNNQGLHYYGIPSDTLIADSIAQRYSDFGLSGSYSSHIKDSAELNYTIGLDYNNYMSKKPIRAGFEDWRARENNVGLTSSWFYKHGKETFAADFNVRYNGYRYGIADSSITTIDSGIVLNNTVINFKPTITSHLKDNRFKAKIGVDIVADIHDVTKIRIFPIAEIKYSMFDDMFIPYAGLTGGLNQTTFKSLTTENEFIISNINLRNEYTSIDFYGGIKGTLSKRISFNAGISFASVKDKALYVTDTLYSIGNKFDVIYDTMTVTTIEASISYQLLERLKIDGVGRFYSYSLNNNPYAWNLPQLQFMIRGSYNLFDKFIFNLDLNLEQGRKALVYAQEDDVTIEDGVFVKNLGFIADANLGVEYRYNKRISAFLQFNNIPSQRYMRWYNAPVNSFQVMGGVTFRL